MILDFDAYSNLDEKTEHIEDEIAEVFNTESGIKILVDELSRVSGEKFNYKVQKHSGYTYKVDEYVAEIETYDVLRAGESVVVFDFLSLEKAEKFVEFMKKECWTHDQYFPQYSVDGYFTIRKSSWKSTMECRTLCNALSYKFNVDIEELIKKNRGKLHGEKYGL